MKKTFLFFLLALSGAPALQAQRLSDMIPENPEPVDTLRGKCLVLEAGGVMTLDTATNRMQLTTDPEGIVVPVNCFCTRTPIDMVPPDLRGMSVGYVVDYFRSDTGAPLDKEKVMMFKIRGKQ